MITPKQGMSPFQLEQARKKLTYERMTAKTPMVGPVQKAKAKVVALTQMIPVKKIKEELKNIGDMIIPIVPNWLLQLDDEEKEHYMVSQVDVDYIVEQEDVQDWSYLFKRFDSLMGNLMKLLNNIRKINYAKIIDNKLLEQEIVNRHIRIKESILEKRPKDDEEKDTRTYRKAGAGNSFIEDLIGIGAAVLTQGTLGIVAGLNEFFSGLYGAFGGGNYSYNYSYLPASADKIAIAEKLEKQYGLEDFQAAAIVGTWMQEGLGKGRPDDIEDAYAAQYGDFGPPPIGSSRVGYGWAQWTNMAPGGRLDRVATAIGVTDRAWTNNDNMKAFDWELQNVFPSLIDDLKNTTDISEAVQLFVHIYEAGGNIGNFVKMHGQSFLPRRIASAESVLSGMTQPNAKGSIVVPELLKQHKVEYNSKNIYDDIGKFIVDRPTIISMEKIKEPLIIIPLERPIGQEILKSLFDKPFQRVEDILKNSGLNVQQQQENALKIIEDEVENGIEDEEKELEEFSKFVKIIEADVEDFRKVEESQIDNFVPILSAPPELQESKKTNIDTISEGTEDPFSQVILFTQDIIVDN